MIFFCLLFLAAADTGNSDAVYYFNLNVKAQTDSQTMTITVQPKRLVSYDLLQKPELNVPQGFAKAAYDAPLHELAMVLPILDASRREFMRRANKYKALMSFRVMLTARKTSGKKIADYDYEVEVGLDKTPGFISLKSKYGDMRVAADQLLTRKGYEDFLQKAIMPYGRATLKLPSDKQFLVDLYIGWPKPSSRSITKVLKAAWPPLVRWSDMSDDVFRLHMGTTSCLLENGEMQTWRSEHQKFTREIVQNLRLAHEAFEAENWVVASIRYQQHLDSLPADRLALRNYIFTKLEMTQPRAALEILDRTEMLWQGDGELLDIRDHLQAEADARLEQRLQDPDAFELTNQMSVEIVTPERGDLVGGHFVASAEIKGATCGIVVARATLNGKLVGQAKKAPLLFPIEKEWLGRMNRLKIQVFFEDGTTNWAETQFRGTTIGENMVVNLVTLRAIVTLNEIKVVSRVIKEEFELMEEGKVLKIKEFSKNKAPLRVAVVLDTSMSMHGKKLYNALNATTEFVQQLEVEDKAAVYTFDPWVMRWSNFSKRHQDIAHQFQTVSPRLSTSLFDAVYVAHQDLMQQDGTRVMIVVSDGQDSNSQIRAEDLRHLLANSPVIFYPVIINADEYHGRKGVSLLEEFARLTGSVSKTVSTEGYVGDTFEGIYQELKSFYLLQYYSNQNRYRTDNVQIRINRVGSEVRFRPFLGPTPEHLLFQSYETPLSTVN